LRSEASRRTLLANCVVPHEGTRLDALAFGAGLPDAAGEFGADLCPNGLKNNLNIRIRSFVETDQPSVVPDLTRQPV
jgi:hypothetical protein